MPYHPKIAKAPGAAYAASLDFSGWSILTGTDTLSSATVAATPTGLTVGTPTVVAATKKVNIGLSGGTDGVTYHLTVTAATAGGEILVGYLDVEVTSSESDGTVVYPSQLLPFVDGARVVELLYDDGELGDAEDVPAATTIDGNARAFALTQAAWRQVLQACRRGDIYRQRELIDLANDPVRGLDLIELVADLFWAKVVKRRRYVQGEPQAEDAGADRALAALDALQKGERIFDLTDVAVTGADGVATGAVYVNEIGQPTRLTVGRFGGACPDRREDRFWGTAGGFPPHRNGRGCC